MGRFFKAPDEANPQGYYEDYVSHGLVRSMVAGVLDPYTYIEIMSEVVKIGLPTLTPKWGAKDPWFLQVKPAWWKNLEPRLGIICARDVIAVTESWCRLQKLMGRKVEQSMWDGYYELTRTRYEACDALKLVWDNVLVLDFNEERTDEWVESAIKERL